MENSKKMLKTAGFMAVATFLAKALGLLRDMLIAAFFGTGIEADAYLTATRLPTMLFDIVIGGVISAAFIPVFNSVLEKKDKEKALEFANRFIGMVLLISGLITILGVVFSDSLITFMVPEFGVEAHNLAKELTMIMFPMIMFTGLAFSFVGILQSFGEFKIPAIMSLVSNLAVIVYFVLCGKRFGVYGLSVTMLLAWALQVIIQIPSLVKFEYKFRPTLNFRDENIKAAMKLALPMLISTWVQPLYTIINTRLASGMASGVSSLEYANRLYLVVTGVFSFVITNLMFPKMSRANVLGKEGEAKEMLVLSLRIVTFVILPVMAVFTVLAKPIIAILYQHGDFILEDTLRTGNALACYSLGMIGMAYNEILSKTFFSMKNSKTPMINALISLVVNVVVAYSLSGSFGISGLAIATACGSTVNAVLNYICIIRHYKTVFEKTDKTDILKIFISTVLMTAVMLLVNVTAFSKTELGFTNGIIIGIVCGGIGVLVYGVACLALKENILFSLVKGAKNK